MDDLRTILDGLEGVQLSYVYARSRVNTKAEAFQESGISKSAFYQLPAATQQHLEEVADQLRRNRVLMAEPKLNDAVEKAVDVLTGLLEAKSEYVRLQAAVAIIERVMGPVVKKTDITSGGQSVNFQIVGLIDDEPAEPNPVRQLPNGSASAIRRD